MEGSEGAKEVIRGREGDGCQEGMNAKMWRAEGREADGG